MVGWNCNSLGTIESQRNFIHKKISIKDSLIVLCNTILGKNDEDSFRKLWEERVFFNSFSSNKHGIAVLIKDKAPVIDLEWKM